MDDETYKRKSEGYKLDHDTYKHLTTLSTGAILILTTFLEKFFQQPKWKFLIGITLISLIISTIASVVAMFGISNDVTTGKDTGNLVFRGTVILISCGGFLLGMLCFVIFALRNFWG